MSTRLRSIRILTIDSLDLTFDGTNFSATSQFGVSGLSWTNPDGSFGGASLGDMSLTWNGSTGVLSLVDLISTDSLNGTVTSLLATLSSPFGATFEAIVALAGPGAYGLSNTVLVSLGSLNFVAGAGTGQADITAVPEPAMLALLGFGAAAAAVRRRRTTRA